MEKEIGKQEPFETEFEFEEYSVTVTQSSIVYHNKDKSESARLPSAFRNRYHHDIVIIKNIYLRFNAYNPMEYKKMFDTLAYIFNLQDFCKL